MLRKLAFVSYVFLCLALRVQYASAQQLILYTEEFPPYNMTENNEVTGVSTEVVTNVMNRVGLAYTIESYPWPRTYKLAQMGPTSLIYSISRGPVGKIYSGGSVLSFLQCTPCFH